MNCMEIIKTILRINVLLISGLYKALYIILGSNRIGRLFTLDPIKYG
jgi:hypothetical protein